MSYALEDQCHCGIFLGPGWWVTHIQGQRDSSSKKPEVYKGFLGASEGLQTTFWTTYISESKEVQVGENPRNLRRTFSVPVEKEIILNIC